MVRVVHRGGGGGGGLGDVHHVLETLGCKGGRGNTSGKQLLHAEEKKNKSELIDLS